MSKYFVKDIDKRYTDIVSSYVSKGYTFHCNTMGGSQGEKAKVHLLSPDKKSLLNIYMDNFSNWEDGTEGIEIVTRKYSADDFNINEYNCFDIVWNNKGNEISNEKFYRVSEYKNNFYADFDTAKKAKSIHYSRLNKRKPMGDVLKDITSDKTIDIVLPLVHKYKDAKATKKKIVSVMKGMSTDTTPHRYYKIKLNNNKTLFI